MALAADNTRLAAELVAAADLVGAGVPDAVAVRADVAFSVVSACCGASPRRRAEFVAAVAQWLHEGVASEFRFEGALGFGGKLYTDHDGSMRVSCYPEDRTEQRDLMVQRANLQLDVLS